jgi:arylsulfatase
MPAAYLMQEHAATFRDFPARQAPPDFNPEHLVDSILKAAAQRQGN